VVHDIIDQDSSAAVVIDHDLSYSARTDPNCSAVVLVALFWTKEPRRRFGILKITGVDVRACDLREAFRLG
jgi:hypothetical protein